MTFQEVIEHIEQCAGALREINRVLRLGGSLIVTTRNPYALHEMKSFFGHEMCNLFRVARGRKRQLKSMVYFDNVEWNRHIYAWTRPMSNSQGAKSSESAERRDLNRASMVSLGPIPFIVYYLRQYVRVNDTVVDLGCGPDRYRAVIAPARYIGLDVTAGPPRRVDVVASADRLPFASASVDLAFSVSALYLFPDIGGVLAEIRRVLRPDGQLLLFDYNRRTQRRLAPLENRDNPAWTQWQLRRNLVLSGFDEVQILAPRVTRAVGRLERCARIMLEELAGTWAVVHGRKANGVTPQFVDREELRSH